MEDERNFHKEVAIKVFLILGVFGICLLAWRVLLWLQDLNVTEPTITSGVVVEKTDYVANSTKHGATEVYLITYEGKNSEGIEERRTDRVTMFTYGQYEVGDTFEREGKVYDGWIDRDVKSD